MFKFTIRDVLWLTVVVLLAVAWIVQIRESQRLGRDAYDTRRAIRDSGYELEGGQLVPLRDTAHAVSDGNSD
jgi:hypothetical protein